MAKGLTGGNTAGGGGGGGNAAPARILSPRGSVIFETRTNQLFVTDIASKLEEVQGLIQRIDIPVRQVLIEARIVEADDKFGRSLGVKLGATDARGLQGGIPGYSLTGSNYLSFGQPAATAKTTPRRWFRNTQFINLPANAINSISLATIAATLFSATANRFLNLELSAWKPMARARSSPVRCADGRPGQGTRGARRGNFLLAGDQQRRR